MVCMSSSSSVASNDSDADVGLLSALLDPSLFSSAPHTAESSDFSFYSTVDSPAGLAQNGSPKAVPAIGLGGSVLVRNSSIGRHAQPSGRVWAAIAPPSVSRMDRRSGVSSSTG